MNRDEIIRMAREAGFEVDSDDVWITDGFWVEELERFAKLVAAFEREECAKVCDARDAAYCAFSIRERGAP